MQPTQQDNGREHIAETLDQAALLAVRHIVDRAGLTLTALQALSRLDQEGTVRLTALAAAEGLSQPSMTQLVQRLERQGLTGRVNDPEDGRAALVYLTDAGRALRARQKQNRRSRLAQLLATLPPEDEAALSLATHVALPIIRRLIETATNPATGKTATSSGTGM